MFKQKKSEENKIFVSILVFACVLVFAPPLSFSYLEPTIEGGTGLNLLPSPTVSSESLFEKKPYNFSNSEVIELAHQDTSNKSDNQNHPLYFQLPSNSLTSELKAHDEKRQQKKEKELRKKFFQVSQALSVLTSGSTGTNLMTSSVNELGHHAIDLWLKEKLGFLPDWADRIELEWTLREDSNFDFQALTIQPLHQTKDGKNILFTQFNVSHLERIQQYRTVTNLGLGYRRLLANNTILLGGNIFYDREWDNSHHRIGTGLEARWYNFDLYANLYRTLGGGRKIEGDTYEESLDGHDIELTSQIPYLPWIRLRGKGFWWETTASSKDIRGWSASTEMDLTRNLLVEFGVNDDNFNDREFFARLRFTVGHDRPTAVSNTIDNKPFQMRNMETHKLDRVRREQKIIVQRSSGSGVVVTRGS